MANPVVVARAAALLTDEKTQTSLPLLWEDAGKAALTRGPLTYCLEEVDNGSDLHLCRVYAGRIGEAQAVPVEISGRRMMALEVPGAREEPGSGPLYRDYAPTKTRPVTLNFIPYFAWANRGEGEMRVWVDTIRIIRGESDHETL